MARQSAHTEDFDKERVDLQTRRNIEGLALEGDGRTEEAVALYEQNIAEGFEGDWPYGQLVAYYEKMGRLDQAQRVMERGIEIFNESKRRTPSDRRAVLRAFKGRLKLIQKRIRAESRETKAKARQK